MRALTAMQSRVLCFGNHYVHVCFTQHVLLHASSHEPRDNQHQSPDLGLVSLLVSTCSSRVLLVLLIVHSLFGVEQQPSLIFRRHLTHGWRHAKANHAKR